MRRSLACGVFLAALTGSVASIAQTPPAGAENVEQVRNAVLNLIRALVDQGVLSAAKAQEMLRQSGMDPALLAAPQTTPAAPAAAAAEPPKPVVRVPYVPEIVKDQLREEVKQEVLAQARAERWGEPGTLPAWLSRITVNGDVRLRYQVDKYASDNAPVTAVDAVYQLPTGTTKNDTETRERMRLRARLGANVRLSEQFSSGVRLTTTAGDDTTTNPLSYNVDLGRYGRPFSTAWDLAFLQWDPISRVRVSGGRTLNPYAGSDLIWAEDLTLDGLFVKWKPRYSFEWSGLFTAGAHPLRVSEPSSLFNTAADQWVYAGQAGISWMAMDESTFNVAGAYYDFSRLEGQLNPLNPPGNSLNSLSAPSFRQRGNTMFNLNFISAPNATPLFGLASKFRLANVTADYEYARFDPFRIGLKLDWVRNLGFDSAEIRNRIGPAIAELPTDATGANGVSRPRINGYLAAFQVGDLQLLEFGDWQWFAGYRYLERDAVPDAFTSPDYRLGGTDNKSAFTGLRLGIAPSVSLTMRYITGRSIDAAPRYSVDTWFFDLNGRF